MEAVKLSQPTETLRDSDIVRRVIEGEKGLFEILMRRNNQTMYRVVRGYLSDEDDIRDIMQNAYMKAFDKLYQFQGNSAFSTWLIRIAINEALMCLKNMKKTKVIDISPEIPDKDPIAEKTIIRQESQMLLEQAIDRLPEKYRVVYIMKEVEDMEIHHVAEILGLTESNVKVRVHRAKAIIKDLLLKFTSGTEVFEFGNSRCDMLVQSVMRGI